MAILRAFTPGRGGGGIVEITPQSINAFEMYIRWAESEVPSRIPIEMDNLVHYMALLNQSYARKMSFGPYDPTGRKTELAWRTPEQGIRRITNAYYLGWKVKKRGLAHYILFNASHEAYYIEYGVSMVGFGAARHVPARRIRRPVRKLSLLKTMNFMKTTQAYHRVWADIYRSRHAHGGFTQHVQSPAGGHLRWENVTAHEAGGIVRKLYMGHGFSGRNAGIRSTSNGWQVRRKNRGGGSYRGPSLGRKLP